MKNTLLFALLILLFSVNTYAKGKKEQKVYVDIMVEQNIMLNKWHKNKMYNKAFESLASTDLGIRLDWKLYKNWGAWARMAFGIRDNGENIPSDLNLFEEIDLNNFYIKDVVKVERRYGSEGVSVKITMGIFYKHTYKKWMFTPYLGLGSDGVTVPSLNYTLKEKETNTAYDISYRWFNTDKDGYKALNYIYFQFKTDRKISNKLNLTFGVSFRHYMVRSIFSTRMYDHYDHRLIKETREGGNFINTLGVSAGISF